MSVAATAIIRPLRGQCLRQAQTGMLTLRVKTPGASIHMRALVPLRPDHVRWQSNHGLRRSDNEPPKPSFKQPMTLRKFLRAAMAQSLRNLAVALSPSGLRAAFRERPLGISFALFMLAVLAAMAVSFGRFFYDAFYGEAFSKFPPDVANSLRRAIYYTKYKPDPELAARFYKKALAQCTELGLDPYSDEVLGIRLQVSLWLESLTNHSGAITVLEAILGDCLKWIEVMEKSVEEGKVDGAGYYLTAGKSPHGEKEAGPSKINQQEKSNGGEDTSKPETLWHKRQRLLRKAVGISVKLGELYANEHILQPEKSHSHLLWAVETSLKEFKRLRTDGKHPGEDKWQSAEELGGSLESLGQDYERKSQFHLAIPLFFQALRLCESPCHRAVIMNNLAGAFAQHPIFVPVKGSSVADSPEALKELFDSSMPTNRKECLDAGINWARNAYQHAKDVKGNERTAECDEACAVALCNWGDVAAMLGDVALAKKKYEQCIEMSKAMGFDAAILQAKEGISKLTTTPREEV